MTELLGWRSPAPLPFTGPELQPHQEHLKMRMQRPPAHPLRNCPSPTHENPSIENTGDDLAGNKPSNRGMQENNLKNHCRVESLP